MQALETAVNPEIDLWAVLSRAAALNDVLIRFGQNLRTIRETAGISQEKLAEEAGLHRTYVSSVERGKRNISLLNIARLAKALGVPMAKLVR
jgi:DNA-binding XRE family transcriptional regulator